MMSAKRKTYLAVAFVVVVASFTLGCDGSKDAKAVWNNGLKKCAVNDQIGPNVVYFGPSNALGPGTIFQKFSDGGIQVSHLADSYGAQKLLAPAKPFDCASNYSTSFKLGGSATLPSTIPVSGSLSANLSSARTVDVTATNLIWDQLIVGDYRSLVNALLETNDVKKDLLENHELVLSRALRVSGMKATLQFTNDAGAAAKLQIPNGSVISKSKDTSAPVELNVSWQGNTQLTLTAQSDFYIAGELRNYTATGLAGPAQEIGPVAPDVKSLHLKK
jgi:hypothetical protein